jgi:hypothetical protein
MTAALDQADPSHMRSLYERWVSTARELQPRDQIG